MFLRKASSKVGQGSYTGDEDQEIEYCVFSCAPYDRTKGNAGKGGMVVAKSKTLFVIGKFDGEMDQTVVDGGKVEKQNFGDVSQAVAFCTAVLNNQGA